MNFGYQLKYVVGILKTYWEINLEAKFAGCHSEWKGLRSLRWQV